MFLAKAIGSIAKLIKGEINFSEFMSEIGSALMALPKLIWSGLVAGFKFLYSKLPTMILTGLLSIPKMIYGFVGKMFNKLGLKKIGSYFDKVSKVFGHLMNIVKAIFTLNFSALWDGIKGLGGALWNVIKSIPGMLWEVIKLIPSLLWKGFKFLLLIPKFLLTALLSVPKMIYGFVGKMFNKLGLKKIGAFFGKVSKVFGSLINIVKAIFTLNFSALWDGIKGLGSALWGVIKSIPGMIWQVITLIPSLLWKGIKGLGGLIWKGIKALPGLLLKGLKWALIGIVAVIIGIPALIIYGLYKALKWLTGMVWKGIKGIGKFLLKLPGMIWSGIKTLVKWLWKAMTFIPVLVWTGIKKLLGLLWSAVVSVGKFIMGIPGMLWRGIKAIPGKIWDGIKWLGGKLADFFSWIWGGIKKLPGMIWDGIVSVFAALPGFMLDAIKWVGKALLKALKWALIGIAAVLIGIPALIIYGLYKAITWLGKMVWKGLKALGKFILKLPGMLWSGFKTVVKLLWKAMTFIPILIWNAMKGMMKWLWKGVKKLGGLLWDGVKAVGSAITYIPRQIWKGIKWVGGKIADGVGWVWDKISDFFGWVWSSVKSVGQYLLALPGKIWDGIKAAAKAVFVDFPVWLWNGFKTALTKVWDWIVSWVPDWMKGESQDERDDRLNPSGEGGIKGAAEYVANAEMGRGAAQIWHGETWGEKAAGLGELAVGTATLPARAAIGAVKTVGGWLSSGWNWLTGKEGISSVKKGGLALIHAGEMVVPAGQSLLDDGAKLSAQGTEGRAGVGSALSGMWDSVKGFFGRGMESAQSAWAKLGEGDLLGAVGDVASGAWDSVGSIAGMFNPVNWFGGGGGGDGGKKESSIVKIPKITPLEAISINVTAIRDLLELGLVKPVEKIGLGEVAEGVKTVKEATQVVQGGLDMRGTGTGGRPIAAEMVKAVDESLLAPGAAEMVTVARATPIEAISHHVAAIRDLLELSLVKPVEKIGLGEMSKAMIRSKSLTGSASQKTEKGGMWGSIKGFFGSGMESAQSAWSKLGQGDILGAAGDVGGGAWNSIGSIAGMMNPVNWFGGESSLGLGETVSAVSAVMPTADIHDRVQRDIATSRSSTAVGGKELSMISSSTDQQCATLVEIRDHLKAMRDTMGQPDTSSGYSSPTAEGGDTSSNIQPKSSPEYYRWQFGQHAQVGNKQVLNPGT
jgi:phage-related protein